MPTRPANVIIGVDDAPNTPTLLAMGLQHCIAMASTLVIAVLVAEAAGVSEGEATRLVELSMIAGGIGTVLQALPRGPIGSGFLCPSLTGPTFLPASLLAAHLGGLPLVFGMTAMAGAFQIVLSRGVHRLRAVLPPEVVGVIVTMVGFSLVGPGVNRLVGRGEAELSGHSVEAVLGVSTLLLMFALTVWGGRRLRLYSVLISIACGYLVAEALGLVEHSGLGSALAFDHPPQPHPPWGLRFDVELVALFLFAGLASALKAIGDISTAQKINDERWSTPDMRSVRGGLLADGLAVLIAGLIGGIGQSTSSSNVGISLATGVTSRRIAFSAGGMFIVFAFIPPLARVFVSMPQPLQGAILLYCSCFIIVAGLQLVMTRVLDTRRTFVVGASFLAGLSIDMLPGVYGGLPPAVSPIFATSLSLATVTAIGLNLVFRLGVKRTANLRLAGGDHHPDRLVEFLHRRAGAWGASRAVLDRATTALLEFAEVAAPMGSDEGGDIEIVAHFDEFRLDLDLRYAGPALELPLERPSLLSSLTDEEQQRLLSGYLIRGACDGAKASRVGGVNLLQLRFEQ